MQTMHLFAGAGGGLLADLILGHRPIVAVEWDPYACQVLRERSADGWFPDLHVWEGDVRLFDPSEYEGRVDCIHAGFPCQDLSVAGKQSGLGEGTRSGLYREVLRIARVVRPRYLFLENVSAIRSNGLEHVLADLAALGYDCRWMCLRASECGAVHRRDRWWCLATPADAGIGRLGESHEWEIQQPRRAETVRAGDNIPDSASQRCGEARSDSQRQAERPAGGGDVLADTISHIRNARQACDTEQSAGRRNACGSVEREDVPDADGKGLQEWIILAGGQGEAGRAQQGKAIERADWWLTEPDVGRVANGVASRVDRLKALGNGQVPLQAAVAWCLLGGPTA